MGADAVTDPSLIADLIRAGIDPDLVARVSSAMIDSYADGVSSVTRDVTSVTVLPTRTASAERQARYRERNALRNETSPVTLVTSRNVTCDNNVLTIEESNIDSKKERGGERNVTSRGTRLTADWKPSDDDLAFAISKGMPRPRIDIEAEKFRNYWTAKTGIAATKRDWSATWRNWVLSSLERAPGLPPPALPRPSGPPQPPSPDLPSHEELLKKYAQPRNPSEGTGLRAEGPRVLQNYIGPKGRPPDNKTRNGGMVQLGALFQGIPGLHSDRHEAGPMGPEPSDDGTGQMA